MKSSRVDHARPFKIALSIGFSVVILAALTVATVKGRFSYQSKAALPCAHACFTNRQNCINNGVIVPGNCPFGWTCCDILSLTPKPTPTSTPKPCVGLNQSCANMGCCSGLFCNSSRICKTLATTSPPTPTPKPPTPTPTRYPTPTPTPHTWL